MTALQAGKIIDGYKLLSHVNSGAVAEIWEVEHLESKKTYAMKVVAAVTGLDADSLKRMSRNFLEVQQADHSNLLPVISFGEFEQRPYAVLPLCDGDLSQEIRSRSLAIIQTSGFSSSPKPVHTEKELAHILKDVSSALAYVHNEMHKVHLDVKPSNILYSKKSEEYSYLLSDFDIADDIKQEVIKRTRLKSKAIEEPSGETVPGSVGYMGPEQNETNYENTAKSDVFALGVTIYELATGKLPAGRSLGQDIFYYGEKAVIPDLPATYFTSGFNLLVKSCMLPDPQDRPRADFLKSSAQYYLQQGAWPGGPLTPSGRFVPPISSRLEAKERVKRWPYAALVLLICGLGYFGLSFYQQAQLDKLPALLSQDGPEKIDKALNLLDEASLLGLPAEQEKLRRELLSIKTALLDDAIELKGMTANNTMNFREKSTRKWGTYQMYCGEIIEPRFDDMSSFKYHYAAVKKGDEVGFVDLRGEEVLFKGGKDPIVKDNRSGFLNGSKIELPAVKNAAECQTK